MQESMCCITKVVNGKGIGGGGVGGMKDREVGGGGRDKVQVAKALREVNPDLMYGEGAMGEGGGAVQWWKKGQGQEGGDGSVWWKEGQGGERGEGYAGRRAVYNLSMKWYISPCLHLPLPSHE